MPSPAQPSVFGAQHLIDRLRCWVRRPLIFQSRLSPPLRRDALGHQAVGAAERFAWLTPELDPRGADEIGTKSTTVKIAAAIYVRCRGSMSAIVLGPHSDRWKRTAGVGAQLPVRQTPRSGNSCPLKMVYRGGRGSHLDDECASPFSDDSGLRSGDLDQSRKER